MVALLPALAIGGSLLGGIQGYRRSGGNLGQAALGAGVGALGGAGAGGVGRFAGKGLGGLMGLGAAEAAGLGTIGGALGGGGAILTGNVGVPVGQNIASGVGQVGTGIRDSASGILGYNAVTGEPMTAVGGAVPPGLGQFGGTNMYGSSPYAVIDPSGPMAGNRLMQRKQAEVTRDNINTIAPTQLKYMEETKRRDLARQLAAAGIRQNIITQATMLQNAQNAGLDMGKTAASQVGGAMANNYSYS
jgi:hypothetical protein